MWFRPGKRPTLKTTTDAEGTTLGIGVPVYVRDPGDEYRDTFPGEPTGLIVGLASTLPRRGMTAQSLQARIWTVAFDEPQHLRDGRGPFETAEISEELLMAAPPVSADDTPLGDDAARDETARSRGSASGDSDQEPGTTTPFS